MKQLLALLFISVASIALSQNTVGLTQYESDNIDGYVLFSPIVSNNTYLIDKCGEKVHEWTTSDNRPALSCFLLEDGSLLRTGQMSNPNFDEGGSGGLIERFDWDGTLNWSYILSDENQCMHHDILPLPNGNILCIVWDRYTKLEAFLQGKDTTGSSSFLWSEKIVELEPVGTDDAVVVWEWKLWDHLVQDFDMSKPNYGVVSASAELVDLNYFPGMAGGPDWIHLNSIDYNPNLDQIILSSHTFSELWIIDHSTTTAEAATNTGGDSGHGGDLLYRWGNPQSYQRGTPLTKTYFGQHHATWIPEGFPNEGKIVVFNNGLSRPGTFSSIDIIDPPLNETNTYDLPIDAAYMPLDVEWRYTATDPSDFYSSNISGVYPLSNGSFMITNGTSGLFFEVDAAKEIQWSYINPVHIGGTFSQGDSPTSNLVFRCTYYPTDYPGFSDHVLTPMGEIELSPTIPSICTLLSNDEETAINTISIYPNPVVSVLTINGINLTDFTYEITGATGRSIMSGQNKMEIDVSDLPNGTYFITIVSNTQQVKTLAFLK